MVNRRAISSEAAPHPVGPYSHAIRAGGFLFCSGQIGTEPATGDLVPGGVGAETARALANLGAVLEAAGVGVEQIVKTTVFLTSMENFAAMDEVYGRFFGASPPARSAVAVKALPKGALVEIDAMAAVAF
ncbi:MAG: Rid family detoxifying hydrolase [Candidatus Methylomirabilales bacterium]